MNLYTIKFSGDKRNSYFTHLKHNVLNLKKKNEPLVKMTSVELFQSCTLNYNQLMKDGDCSMCVYIYTRKNLEECWFVNKAYKACTDGCFLISRYYRTYNYLCLQQNHI